MPRVTNIHFILSQCDCIYATLGLATMQGRRKVGARGALAPPQYLADQLTLS